MGAKRHLAQQNSPPVTRAACGIKDPPRWTFRASDVTCEGCRRTLRMADAELMEGKSNQSKQ